MLKLVTSFTLMRMSLQEYAGFQFLCIFVIYITSVKVIVMISNFTLTSTVFGLFLLHFAKRNVHWPRSSVCVSVSLCPAPHSTLLHTPACNFGEWCGFPSSCVLLGGFAISACVSLLWQLTCLMQNVSEYSCTRCMAVFCVL